MVFDKQPGGLVRALAVANQKCEPAIGTRPNAYQPCVLNYVLSVRNPGRDFPEAEPVTCGQGIMRPVREYVA